ncbi:MAG: ComEC family competence protein [Alphaproteobacteria bacterium]|nr:ComEC family competence protein [Alphaproteobacteria bacterium]MBP7761055.1 ComEC family competence protein [Alphaproteobacteria bacterium]MBP7904571.1 ComEC family competence protein [Alphaproteobacteria bacterium]
MLEAQSLDGIAPETELAGTARRIRLWILEQIALQKDRAALWLPVLLGLGIGIYFALPEEPPLVLGLFTWVLMAAVLAAIWPYRFGKKGRKLYFGIIIMLLPLTGFAAAQIRTHKAFTPMIERKIGPVTLTGTIRSVEKLPGKKGSRVVLDGLRIEDIEPSKTPRLVRLQLRQDSDIRVGQKISALAELTPPSAPVYPGGYDFRRSFYFQGIGAVGFIYRAPEILAQPTQGLWNIEGLRQSIAGVLWRELPAEQAAIVSALTIGQQKGIPEKDEEDLRDAGLAHLLAISGMNISFVAGLIFFLTRLLLAASPVLALKFPIKKIAATLSFAGAVFYMMLSGAEVPVQRAVLMTGIVILAIIMDRTPISLRLVSFSAFVILLVSPESLISASFQMSFGAVIALVAFYEGTEQFWIRSYRDAGPLRRIALYFIGVCLSSLIASTATAPFAAYHFQQFPTYGLLANLMAVPLMGFLIMPAGLAAFILMPFGLSYWPLQLMALGVNWTMDIARWTAGLPGAVLNLESWPFETFMAFVFAGLLICLWKGQGKTLSIVFAAAGIFALLPHSPPDILVSETGKLIAYLGADGQIHVNSKRTEKFVLENWERQAGLPEGSSIPFPKSTSSKQATEDSALLCDTQACRITVKAKNISLVSDPYALPFECAWADILIVAQEPITEEDCRSSVKIDRFTLWREGAQAVWIDDGQKTIKTLSTYMMTGKRPWSIRREQPSRN